MVISFSGGKMAQQGAPRVDLTTAQQELLRLYAQGYNEHQIVGRASFCSTITGVRTVHDEVMRRLGVDTIAAAIRCAEEHGYTIRPKQRTN